MVVWDDSPDKLVPKYILESFIDVEFEGEQYRTTKYYDEYLKIMYGMDYMQLPELDKRYNHAIKAWWK